MAREVGFEPTTTGLEDRCSIQLSYSRNFGDKKLGLEIISKPVLLYSNKNK